VSRKVVISYNRKSEGVFANLLYRRLEDAGFEPWMDKLDTQSGSWQPQVDEAILSAIALIVLISPESMASRHVNYEWQFALGAGVEVIPILLKDTDHLHPRLELMNRINFTETIIWDEVISKLGNAVNNPLTRVKQRTNLVFRKIEQNNAYHTNRGFAHVIIKSIDELLGHLEVAGNKYGIPASEYPYYLLSLQKDAGAIVKAVAIIDKEEFFWQQNIGHEIMHSSHRQSTRVFIFPNSTKLEERFDLLVKYSEIYNVHAMSSIYLARDFPMFAEDFAVIQIGDTKLLAKYEETSLIKMIVFSTDRTEVDLYETQLNRIFRRSEKISQNTDVERIKSRVFPKAKNGSMPFLHKPIEMSDYIAIDEYDQFEEFHAYFQDMMQKMLSIIPTTSNHKPWKVLELGAGTGIFTKRLAGIANLEVVAVELDWVCFNRLSHNMRKLKRDQSSNPSIPVALYNEDSITFTSQYGFDFIFSSFADHHIRGPMKETYFRNIKQNLARGGTFIVGDEFLPPYDPNNKAQYEQSLRTYHNHIIEIAENKAREEEAKLSDSSLSKDDILATKKLIEAYHELAELEKAALDSGLAEQGDFKVSCEIYESELSKSGLSFRKEKIGPLGNDKVGGIYVYFIQDKD